MEDDATSPALPVEPDPGVRFDPSAPAGPAGHSPSPAPVGEAGSRWSVTERFLRWRDGVRARPSAYALYRVGVAVVGGAFVLGGLALVPLPGPGWLVVILGLIVLASEFVWAAHVLGFTRRTLNAWTDWVKASPIWVRIALAVGTCAFVAGVLWVLLSVTGVPGWVPDGWLDWVPGV